MTRPLPGGAPDDGRPDARLAAALAALDGSPAARAEVLAALVGARVFSAVEARATTVDDRGADSTAEMALVGLGTSTGGLAVPLFTDGHEVQRWTASARPVPLPGPQACAAALDAGAEAVVLDPLGARLVVGADEARELAAGRVPVPGAALSARRGSGALGQPAAVPDGLVAALRAALAGEPLRAARLLEGDDGLVLGVAPEAPLGPAGLAALASRLLPRLGAALPPEGLDVAEVAPQGPGVVVLERGAPARRRWWRR